MLWFEILKFAQLAKLTMASLSFCMIFEGSSNPSKYKKDEEKDFSKFLSCFLTDFLLNILLLLFLLIY